MKAICVHQFGGPEVLRLEEVPDPVPGPGQAVVELKAAGVNPVETYIRSGRYQTLPPLPYTPGGDGAGVIKSVGTGVKKFTAGERVFLAGTRSGSYAQQALCQIDQVFSLPESVSFEQGAALGVPYATAFRALFGRAKIVARETVLIHGASGGVGTAAVQWAKAAEARVIGSAGSERGLALIRELGADFAVDHREESHFKEVMEITQGRGVDVVIEMLANVNLGKDLLILARGGRVVVVGCRGEVTINPRDVMKQETAILAVLGIPTEEKGKVFSAVAQGLESGKLKPVVGRTFPLAEAGLAQQTVMEAGAYGKIVLIP